MPAMAVSADAPATPPATGTGAADVAIRQALAQGRYSDALTRLMESHGDRLYRFCRSMVKSPDLAADVHQVIFINAHEGLLRGDRIDDFEAWLYGIARHRCLDALKIRRRWYDRFRLGGPGRVGGSDQQEAPDGARPPDQLVVEGERRLALIDCLQDLAPHVRAAIVLHFQEELTFEAMATIDGERAPTLQARVSRAMPVLRRCLEEKGWG
jgi:RNA polymerase sigma factor (sigma-70 family)